MAKLTVKAQASANRIEHVFIQDSTSTTGAGKTGLTNSSVTAYYIRPGGDPTSITLNAGTLKTFPSVNTDTEGTLVKVDDTNMPGLYEVCLPNNVFKTGVNHAVVMIKGTGIAPVLLEYDLVAYDPLVGTNLGLSALPTANHSTSGGLLTYGTGNGQIDATTGYVPANTTRLAGQTVSASSTVTFPSSVGTSTLTAANVWDHNVSAYSTAGFAGTFVKNLDAAITSRLAPTTSGRTLDVNANGEAGIDWGNIGNPTTSVAFTGTTISTSQQVASVTGNVAGSVGSVTGNVAGSVNSVVTAVTVGSINADTITATSIQADAITAAKLANDVATEIATGVWANGTRALTATGNSGVADAVWKSILTVDSASVAWPNNTFGNSVLRAYNNTNAFIKTTGAGAGHVAADVHEIQTNVTNTISDGVWDEPLSGHLTSGSTGAALNAAGAAGDPWSTSLPGVYGAGTAGYLLGTNLDARVSTRSTLTATDVWGAATRTLTGSVTVGTNNDKTGYSLASSQTFSTTGSVGSVAGSVGSVSSAVTVGTNNDKTGYSLSASQTFSTTGSVGSVTGDVEGSVIGSVGSVDSTVSVGSINTGAITANAIASNAITSAKIDASAKSDISDAVWDKVRGGSRPAGSFGEYLDMKVSTVNTSVGSVSTSLSTVASDVSTIKTNTDGVEAVTDKLNTTLQVVPGTSNYRFTASALSLAPTAGSVTQYVPVTLPLGTNARQTLTFNEGASLPVREDILQEQDRTPLDLSTADSVVYELMAVDSSSPKVYATATVVDAAAGRVRYTWQAGDLDEVGTYRERWVVTFPTGQTSIFGPLIKVV